jgi:hypothetical protein
VQPDQSEKTAEHHPAIQHHSGHQQRDEIAADGILDRLGGQFNALFP